MISWSTKRKSLYILILMSPLIIYIGIYFLQSYRPPTCFDGKHNGLEGGVDCGGGCERVCSESVKQPEVLWTRIFETGDGRYNALAYVQNINPGIWARDARYEFRVYSASGEVLATESGNTFISPKNEFPIFAGPIRILGDTPARIEFEFLPGIVWEKISPENNTLDIENQKLENTENAPRLSALVRNNGLLPYSDIEAVALVYSEGEPIAISRTFLEYLDRGDVGPLNFTWTRPFVQSTITECASPIDVMLVIDRSGSMNNDAPNPPEPLTSVKNAAQTFVDILSKDDKIGLVSFATLASFPIDQELTIGKSAVKRAVDSIRITPEEEQGATNLGDALDKAGIELKDNARIFDGNTLGQAMVVLTDGLANAPEIPGGEPYAKEKSDIVKSNGIELYIIGLGGAVNRPYLQSIASSPTHYYDALTRRDVEDIYRQIATKLCEIRTGGPSVVEIILRTPDFYRN